MDPTTYHGRRLKGHETTRSCILCAQSKRKCSGNRPCDRCVMSGTSKDCIDAPIGYKRLYFRSASISSSGSSTASSTTTTTSSTPTSYSSSLTSAYPSSSSVSSVSTSMVSRSMIPPEFPPVKRNINPIKNPIKQHEPLSTLPITKVSENSVRSSNVRTSARIMNARTANNTTIPIPFVPTTFVPSRPSASQKNISFPSHTSTTGTYPNPLRSSSSSFFSAASLNIQGKGIHLQPPPPPSVQPWYPFLNSTTPTVRNPSSSLPLQPTIQNNNHQHHHHHPQSLIYPQNHPSNIIIRNTTEKLYLSPNFEEDIPHHPPPPTTMITRSNPPPSSPFLSMRPPLHPTQFNSNQASSSTTVQPSIMSSFASSSFGNYPYRPTMNGSKASPNSHNNHRPNHNNMELDLDADFYASSLVYITPSPDATNTVHPSIQSFTVHHQNGSNNYNHQHSPNADPSNNTYTTNNNYPRSQ